MFQHWLFREPSLCFGLPVFVIAAVAFPLHLGWTGASLVSFAGYLVIAAFLFSLVDAWSHPSFYPEWVAILPQSILSLFAIVLPAVLAFAVGSAVGPAEEAFDEEICASRGAAEDDSSAAEADDTFDVTPDCSVQAVTRRAGP